MVRVRDEKASALKKIEDEVDTIMCVYVAASAWLGLGNACALWSRLIVLPKRIVGR
jgi:predicted RNase H-like nuclease